MPNGRPAGASVGRSSYPAAASGAHNFARDYYRHFGASGDVRARYSDLEFTSTGSGETLRLRGIVNGTGCAATGTINALHATGRIAAGKTLATSGCLNAIRATLEKATTSGTTSGVSACIQVDSNIAHDTTNGPNDAFIRVTNSGAHTLDNLFNIEVTKGSAGAATSLVCTDHANDITANTFIRIMVNGTAHWILATTTAPAAS